MTKVTAVITSTGTLLVREYTYESEARDYADLLIKGGTAHDIKVYTW
jgi:hypothetical protein